MTDAPVVDDPARIVELSPEEPAVITGSREQLLYLLAEAAEIEHTLMACYLYAAFSLKRPGEPGLDAREADAVGRWRAVIMDVAVQEMGHLMIVANLTVACGGRPHFGRPNFPISPGYFPSGVVVRLAGFSRATLDHFIFLERPQGVDGTDPDAFDQQDYSRAPTIVGLMPSAQDYTTIGHLYESIRANLDDLATRLGGDALLIGPVDGQVGPEVMDLPGVTPIDSLDAARAAIDTVIDQGEGSKSDREESHYRSFLAIRDEFDALLAANPDFAPAWPVADNPVLRRPPSPDDKVLVDDPDAARLLDFGCAAYGLLLRLLVQCFGRGDAAEADQRRLMDAAIALMHVVGASGDALARRPASAQAPGVNAGLSFTMLRGVEPLLRGRAETRLLREQLQRLVDAVPTLPPVPGLERAGLGALAERFAVGVDPDFDEPTAG